jgi:hypothetical protein
LQVSLQRWCQNQRGQKLRKILSSRLLFDLDRIPLADKDHLIADTRCEFDFADLQSWLKEVFLDQSDEIGLWESNLPLYLFPQVHHFPEFTLKCQAHYIPTREP